ncbi:MAG TPA: NAD(P)H-dependent oxidoreductase subunit E [Spirochaetota bacterium]|nr:NAD(P)H-dependent oxidoreductase subunit E [Spirochaetota bacterium]HOM38881.1 NAD(P)H-dependent oxidoreductase subunit E [Spirochaetota bacterium]HPQ49176.1 NAD(P)H-dependent oxidoreductase subunit E [Spirochaetota bacterium]
MENKREDIILAFHKAQEESGSNYIPIEKVKDIAKNFNVSLSEVSGLLTFYTMFSTEKRGKYIIRVCDSLSCRLMHSIDILLYIQNKLGIDEGKTTKDGLFTIERVNCLGRCFSAPNMMINDKIYGNLTPEKIDNIISEIIKEEKND